VGDSSGGGPPRRSSSGRRGPRQRWTGGALEGGGVGQMATEALQQHCNGRRPGAVRRVRIRSQCKFGRGERSTAACGGKLWRTGTCSTAGGGKVVSDKLQSREQSGAGGGRERRFSQGPVCKTKEIQGLYGKLIFPNDTKT
jgi:hypothetical protein